MFDIDRNVIHMYDLLTCLTNAVDLVSPRVAEHHQQVSYLAFCIAEQMGLPEEERKDLLLSGLLHDIGAFSLDERLELTENEPPTAQDHAFRGARLLEDFGPLRRPAGIIRHHHIPWADGGGRRFLGREVSPLSHVLHLADRVAVLIDRDQNVLGQIRGIRARIEAQRGSVFLPEAVDAFLQISDREYIWLDAVYQPPLRTLPGTTVFDSVELDLDDLSKLTSIFANIIDFRSPYTAKHSAGVAKTAEKLAEFAGFSQNECKMMRVAGYLHDLGKLAVPNEILEKEGRLTQDEYNQIKSHSFYTYRLLEQIHGFETINKWAALHHEKLNGTGYPFHLRAQELSLGSRIMAVADIFTAITEDRPYRRGMGDAQTVAVLDNFVRSGAICPYVVSILREHFDVVSALRREAQQEASRKYRYVLADTTEANA